MQACWGRMKLGVHLGSERICAWVNLQSSPYGHEPLFLLKRMQWSGLDRFAGSMRGFAGENRGMKDEELGEGEWNGLE